jgi:hypothetical protein
MAANVSSVSFEHHVLIDPLFSFLSLLRGNRIAFTVHDATIGQWTAQVTVQ